MDSRERLLSHKVRQEAGRPTETEQSAYLSKLFPVMSTEQLKRYADEDFSLRALGALKAAHEKGGQSTSRVALSASLVRHVIASGLEKYAQQYLADGDLPTYRFIDDVQSGMRTTMTILLLAEIEIAGEAEGEAVRDISYAGEIDGTTVAEQAGEFLLHRNEARRDADLLLKDHSGFNLVDDYILDLEANWDSTLPESREYVLAGAKLAADLYKSIYKASSKLSS